VSQPTADDLTPVTQPTVSRGRANQGVYSFSAPQEPVMLDVEGDLQDDAVFRSFIARQVATQTLSQQRAEWYARSTRLHVMVAFWLGMIGAIVGIILLAVLVASGSGTDPSGTYFP
jgi:hypothetical protein